MRLIDTGKLLATGLLAAALSQGAIAEDNPVRTYDITITNLTKSVQFTPILAASHNQRISMFEAGEPATDELAALAEGGAVGPLAELLVGTGLVFDAANSADVLPAPPLLFAGQSVTLRVNARNGRNRLSLAAMLLPTNDTFVALNSVPFPMSGSDTFYANAWDAGSEPNDEFCANIPGPTCGGEGNSPTAGGEGFVHIANGIHGIADLDESVYDWRGPVARVVVTRVR